MCSLCTQSTFHTPHFRHLYELAHRRYGSSGSSCAPSSNGVDAAALKLGELHMGFGGAAGREGAAAGGESTVNTVERRNETVVASDTAVPIDAVPAPAASERGGDTVAASPAGGEGAAGGGESKAEERESDPVAAPPAGPCPPPDWAAEALAFDSVEAWFHEVSPPPLPAEAWTPCTVVDPALPHAPLHPKMGSVNT